MAAASSQEASTSSPSSSLYNYHAFLSFRGNDTGKSFSDLLYAALEQAGFHTFRDDDGIERGDDIDAELQKAMQESKIYLIVFSRDYASSRWCLDELVKVMEQKETMRKIVVPVFYDASPDDVWEQTGSFAEAFARHENFFNGEIYKVERWKKALRDVAELGGMVSKDGYEAKFIQEIVEMVGNKLKSSVLHGPSYLVGMESRVQGINQWLQDGSDEVGIAIIYGLGGIGKTTIAKTVYNLNLDRFEATCFLAKVRETSKSSDGKITLQRQLLEKVRHGKTRKINNADEGIIEIQDAISCRRVLIVFDDIDHSDQITAIIGAWDWLYEGSKIIITTRHERLLKAHESCKKFRVKELDFNESLQLFSWYAFGQVHPLEDCIRYSETVVNYCCGLPLALEVLGTSLSEKNIYEWENTLEELEAIPDGKIQKTLKISYDSLKDDHEKNLFLDIACFFIGKDKDNVVNILDGCGFSTKAGIQNLIDQHLISINESNKLMMNRLIRDMGREIVHQESPEDPGKRSRLWHHEEACTVLREKFGTEAIKGLTLDWHITMENKQFKNSYVNCTKRHYHQDLNYKAALKRHCLGFFSRQPSDATLTTSLPMRNEVSFETKAFAKMRNLKLLQLNYVKLNGSYENFPKSLVWLCWHGFPLKSIPSNLCLENVLVLDMRRSSLKHIWSKERLFMELKILNLSHSHGLFSTPDFSGVPNLERLLLKDCINLTKIHDSIGDLERLVFFNLKGCKKLRKLPAKIVMSKSLEELNLSGCSKLDELPKDLQEMKSLRVLRADGIAIRQLGSTTTSWHSSLWFLLSPRKSVRSTFSLAFLPQSIVHLSLADCNLSDDAIPYIVSSLPFLRYLNLSGNSICCLPENINSFAMLESLLLDHCSMLQSIPELPMSLKELSAENCALLERVTNLPNLFRSLKLKIIGCKHLVEVQGLFKLEPISKLDGEMVNNLGFINLESVRNMEVQISNNMTMTSRTIPLQVLYECGICSIFLPGNEIPNCYKFQEESSFFFDVPLHCDQKIYGFSICIAYTNISLETVLSDHQHIKISNNTKGVKWIYSPTFHAIPENNKDMLWLSHWKLKDQLESGDQVNISVSMSSSYQVKKCGIHPVYKQGREDTQLTDEEILPNKNPCNPGLTDGDLQAYRVGKAAFFLCNYDYLTHQESSECSGDSLKCSLLFEQ